MIETDREIMSKISRFNEKIVELNREKKFLEITAKLTIPFWLISIILTSIGICSLTQNVVTLCIAVDAFFILYLFVLNFYNKGLQRTIKKVSVEIKQYQKQKEKTKDFSLYLTAYRHIEALNQGYKIYSELRKNDSEYVISKYEYKYEKERVEYEKRHIEFLKLNPHYLDEKLQKAPIESYPIQEQKLLKQRQEKLNQN